MQMEVKWLEYLLTTHPTLVHIEEIRIPLHKIVTIDLCINQAFFSLCSEALTSGVLLPLWICPPSVSQFQRW